MFGFFHRLAQEFFELRSVWKLQKKKKKFLHSGSDHGVKRWKTTSATLRFLLEFPSICFWQRSLRLVIVIRLRCIIPGRETAHQLPLYNVCFCVTRMWTAQQHAQVLDLKSKMNVAADKTHVMYSLVLLMMCRVRGLIPAGSFSSAWIRGISSPVSKFLIITIASISWLNVTHTVSVWMGGCSLWEGFKLNKQG